jgi:antitoxin (DNA-binding transcriptional repressor) of toxin-antitoxin stability system
MEIQIEIATLGPKFEALVNELAQNGGEVCITRDGKIVARLVLVDNVPESHDQSPSDRVLYKGVWMSRAGAEREHSLEPLRGTIKILGDIESPIDDVEWDALK